MKVKFKRIEELSPDFQSQQSGILQKAAYPLNKEIQQSSSNLNSSKDSSVNRKVKFTLQPQAESERLIERTAKQHNSAQVSRKQSRDNSKGSIQLDNDMIMNFGSLLQPKFDQLGKGSSREILSLSNVFPRRGIKQQSKLVTSILNDAISPNRPQEKKKSSNTLRSRVSVS